MLKSVPFLGSAVIGTVALLHGPRLSAQDPTQPVGTERDAGLVEVSTSYRWVDGDAASDERLVDGARIRMLRTPEGLVALYLERVDKPAAVWFYVKNDGTRRFDIEPTRFEFRAASGDGYRDLSYWSPKDVISDATRLRFLEGLALGLSAYAEAKERSEGIQTTGNMRVSTPSGSATVSYSERTTYPNTGPSQTGIAAARLADQKSTTASQRVDGVLLANTVDPGVELSGLVYFDAPQREATTLLVRIPLRYGTAEIPLDLTAFDGRGFAKSAKKDSKPAGTWDY